MGYRSDVMIATTTEGFNYIKTQCADRKYLMSDLDYYETEAEKDTVLFGWCGVKWYNGYIGVNSIMESLKELKEQNISYEFVRVGEDPDDYEKDEYEGSKELSISIYPELTIGIYGIPKYNNVLLSGADVDGDVK